MSAMSALVLAMNLAVIGLAVYSLWCASKILDHLIADLGWWVAPAVGVLWLSFMGVAIYYGWPPP